MDAVVTGITEENGGKEMARGNKRGPNEMGPMTGRGLGYCAGHEGPGCESSEGLAGGRGRGLGRGQGRGMGRGLGRGFGQGRGNGPGGGMGFRSRRNAIDDVYSEELIPTSALTEELASIKKELKSLKKTLKKDNNQED